MLVTGNTALYQRLQALGYDLYKLCTEGPAEELDKTDRSQPAIYVASLAAMEKLRQDNPAAIENCRAAAGCR